VRRVVAVTARDPLIDLGWHRPGDDSAQTVEPCEVDRPGLDGLLLRTQLADEIVALLLHRLDRRWVDAVPDLPRHQVDLVVAPDLLPPGEDRTGVPGAFVRRLDHCPPDHDPLLLAG